MQLAYNFCACKHLGAYARLSKAPRRGSPERLGEAPLGEVLLGA